MIMKTYILLAEGFEEIEALIPNDILLRSGVETVLVSISEQKTVKSSHGVEVVANCCLSETDLSDGDMIFLPGGMPGSLNLANCAPLAEYIKQYAEEGKWLAAICAAPLVLGRMGLLNGKNATCYPSFEPELLGANPVKKTCVRDGKIITGCGPGAASALGHVMAEVLVGKEKADTVLKQMMFNVYE